MASTLRVAVDEEQLEEIKFSDTHECVDPIAMDEFYLLYNAVKTENLRVLMS